MPNLKGGKNYKKSKNSNQTESDFFERQDDQLYGRIIKLLGNCNVMVFCNDGKRRLCHIRGGIRKKVWLNVGDIVLVSLREFAEENAKDSKLQKGDIINKYEQEHMSKLKKDPYFNQVLLNQVEKLADDSDAWDKIMYKPSDAGLLAEGMSSGNDDGFEFDTGEVGGEGDLEDDMSDHDERKKPDYNKKRIEKSLAAQFDSGYGGAKKPASSSDDIDIDAI
jgi:translation initiation factor 1A